ncbi:MAG TPA: hypothetical protein VHQ41_01545 [Patescibacteria group bacterium]|jgi:hypothetical protein|nr:hypothetical protein [Patescibacteria group bacterium]
MAGIKETITVNVQGALLGAQEGGFSFVTQFRNLPTWKRNLILTVAIAIIPVYLIARIGTEQFLAQRYAREALSAQSAFKMSQAPVVGDMTIITNPDGSSSGLVLVTNPNLDLAATGITYTANFYGSDKKMVGTTAGTLYLLPNEKKYVVFAKIDSSNLAVASGKIEIANVNWQKKINIPEVKLRATEPILYDEANPLTFIAEGSIINDSPYQIASARIVFLLYGENNQIIGVSQRDEYKLVPFGRRAYKQLWPGLYQAQVKKVQVIPVTNALDPKNITVETNEPVNTNTNTDAF